MGSKTTAGRQGASVGMALGALLALMLVAPSSALAGVASISGQTLNYVAGPENNDVNVSLSGGNYEIRELFSPVTPGLGCSKLDNFTAQCPDTGVTQINIDVGDGDNRVWVNPSITTNASIAGGEGYDNLQGGRGNDTLTAGSGNDDLFGKNGNDILDAGDGTGQWLEGGTGDDTLTAGSGNDNLYGDNGNDTLTAGSGNDNLYGNKGNDILDAGDGNSQELRGGEGDDTLTAGSGNDTLYGNDGNDTLTAGSGNDTLYGNDGNDVLDAGVGTGQEVRGGDGTDVVDLSSRTGDLTVDLDHVGPGPQTIQPGESATLYDVEGVNGGSGQDWLFGRDAGADTIDGGGGPDVLDGRGGSDSLAGGDGSDFLIGRDGADTLNGGAGADNLNGSSGNDILNGGPGPDVFSGGADNDTVGARDNDTDASIACGAGTDTAVVDLPDPVDADCESVDRPPPPAPPLPPASPPPPGAPPVAAQDTQGPIVRISRRSLRMSRTGVVGVRISCPAEETGGCKGRVTLRTARKVRAAAKRKKARKVKLGARSFSIAAGRTRTVRVKCSRRARRLVVRLRRVRVAVAVVARDQAGNAKTTKRALTLRAPRRKR